MKVLFLVVKVVLFLLALTFAVKNTDQVSVRYYLGLQWQAPLIFVTLVVFCLGAVAGVFASLAHIVRLRRDLSRTQRELGDARKVVPSESAAAQAVSVSPAVASAVPPAAGAL